MESKSKQLMDGGWGKSSKNCILYRGSMQISQVKSAQRYIHVFVIVLLF